MKNSKLVRLLQTLSGKELNEFRRYMQSGFFNRRQMLDEFASYLISLIKKEQPIPEREQLFRKFFKEDLPKYRSLEASAQEKLMRKRMDTLKYELKNHLEDYLVWKEGQKMGIERERVLLAAYETRRADSFFFEQYEKMNRTLNKGGRPFVIDHFWNYFLEQQVREHPGYMRWTETRVNLGKMQEQLDIYFMIQKLMNSWVMLMEGIMAGRQTPILLLEEMLTLAGKEPFRGNIFIDVYHRALTDLQNDSLSLQGMRWIRQRLFPEIEKRTSLEQLGLYSLVINYHILMEIYARESAGIDFFEILQIGLKKGYLIRNGSLGYSDFCNLVGVAIQVGELAWAGTFIDEYKHLLLEHIRIPTVILQKAKVQHAEGKQREALTTLSQKQAFTSPMDKILERLLRIQCYFELEEHELLESILESTRKHIGRGAVLGGGFRIQINNFLKFTLQLKQARQSLDPVGAVESMLKELEKNDPVVLFRWLEMQAKALLDAERS